MSFLDRISGRDPAPPAAAKAAASHFDELDPPDNPMERTVRLGQRTLIPGERAGDDDSSIISQAAPSELAADFAESRHAGTRSADDVFPSGLPVLGVNGNVIIGHGISNEVTIKNMVLFTRDVVESRLNDRIREALV